MTARNHPSAVFAILLVALSAASATGAWILDLPESANVAGGTARLADVVAGPIPEAAGELVVVAGGRPGASVEVSGRAILRRLVMAGLADDVRLDGAATCRITFAGRAVVNTELSDRIHDLLRAHVPPAADDAPPSWLALEVPDVELHTAGAWRVEWPDPRSLTPGRNLVTVRLCEGGRSRRLSVSAVLHAYARTATTAATVPRGHAPDAAALHWTWTDLATAPTGVVTDPIALAGMIATRDLAPGEAIDHDDLEPRPVVERGEMVDLVVRRGGISAVVRAECRQDGLLGETVSVRNQHDGRLLVARVAGPGVVTMGR